MKKSLIPNDERIFNRPDKDGNYPSVKDFFNAGTEENETMKYQNHEIEIIQDIGRNVIIKRVDGGKFTTCSMLRHHRGRKVMAETLSVSKESIEYSFSEMVDHYAKVMTSKTAEFELPE